MKKATVYMLPAIEVKTFQLESGFFGVQVENNILRLQDGVSDLFVGTLTHFYVVIEDVK